MVCLLPTDFSYHWSRLWLLLQESWRSLKKLEKAWRSFKILAAFDSSCSGWFELRRLIRDLRPIDYLQNFDSDPPLIVVLRLQSSTYSCLSKRIYAWIQCFKTFLLKLLSIKSLWRRTSVWLHVFDLPIWFSSFLTVI